MDPGMFNGLDKLLYGVGIFIIVVAFGAGFLLGHC